MALSPSNLTFELQRRRLTGTQPLVTPETLGAPKPMVTPITPAQTGLAPLPKPNIGPTAPPPTGPGPYIGLPPQPGVGVVPPPRPAFPPPTGAQPIGDPYIGYRPPSGMQLPSQPVPQTGTQPLQEFGPGNDLRSTQINPVTGDRLQGVQQGTDVLFRALAGGPDLTQAALEKFKLFGEQTADQRQRGIRDIGQAAARLGRLGSGMVTTDLGNLEERLRLSEDQARRGLASDVAFGEGAERRANLGAGSAFESQLYGQGRGLREEARTERGYQAGQAQQAFEQEILRRQLQANYEQMLRELGLQGAALYGRQAAAGQEAAGNLLAGAL